MAESTAEPEPAAYEEYELVCPRCLALRAYESELEGGIVEPLHAFERLGYYDWEFCDEHALDGCGCCGKSLAACARARCCRECCHGRDA